jgi:hypothetical protein
VNSRCPCLQDGFARALPGLNVWQRDVVASFYPPLEADVRTPHVGELTAAQPCRSITRTEGSSAPPSAENAGVMRMLPQEHPYTYPRKPAVRSCNMMC